MKHASASALCLTLFVAGWAIGRGFGMRGQSTDKAPPNGDGGAALVTALPLAGSGGGARRGLGPHRDFIIEIQEQYESLGEFRFGQWFEERVAGMSFAEMGQLSHELCAMERRNLLELGDARQLLHQIMFDIDPRAAVVEMLREAEWERATMGDDDMDVDLEYDVALMLGELGETDPDVVVELVGGVENKLALQTLFEQSEYFVSFENFDRLLHIAKSADAVDYLFFALDDLNKAHPVRTAQLVAAIQDPRTRRSALRVIAPRTARTPPPRSAVEERLQKDPAGLIAELRATPNGSTKLAMVEQLPGSLGHEAAALMAELPPTASYHQAVASFAQQWARNDAPAAVAWAASLDRPFLQSNGLAKWLGDDLDGATGWVETLPAGALRRQAVEKAVLHLARSEPDAARALASRLAPDRVLELEPKIKSYE